MRLDLIVIDGQNDFLADGTEPENWSWPMGGRQRGALCVEGANKEAVKVAAMIDRLADNNVPGRHKIQKIHATLDSHHRLDCAHNIVWKNGNTGQCADPFTIVTHQNVVDQLYVPTFKMGVWEGKPVPALEWAKLYTSALEKRGRNPLCLWPPHCLIGSWGQNVYQPLMEAYNRWCDTTGGWINWVSKGQWVWTEHYSAIIADVPDSTRLETQMNAGLINDAAGADMIAWLGWAGSHCQRWTAKDAVDYFEPSDDEKAQGATNEFVKKSVFFEDASAPVVSPDPSPIIDPATKQQLFDNATHMFKVWQEEFLHEMDSRGATITNTESFLKKAA